MPNDPQPAGKLPAERPAQRLEMIGITGRLPPALALFMDDVLFERAKTIASYLANATGFVPSHLENKPQACFAVVTRAITWRLDPYAVAQATYQTPGGKVGFEGKLCQAILENSGQIEGPVRFDHYGDWSKIQGKFALKTNDKGKQYPVIAWKEEDEAGVGVKVIVQVRGEAEPRTLDFDLRQAFPRNSTLWATDPKTQIKYTAVRRFATSVAPGIFMGVPFDREDDAPQLVRGADGVYVPGETIEAPPRPTRGNGATAPVEQWPLYDETGEIVHVYTHADDYAEHFARLLKAPGVDFNEVWAKNAAGLAALQKVTEIGEGWAKHLGAVFQEACAAAEGQEPAGAIANAQADSGGGGNNTTASTSAPVAETTAAAPAQPKDQRTGEDSLADWRIAVPKAKRGGLDWDSWAAAMTDAVDNLEPEGVAKLKQANIVALGNFKKADPHAAATLEKRMAEIMGQSAV